MSRFTTTVFAACLTLGSAGAMAQGTPGSTGEAGAMPATSGAMKPMPKDSMPKQSMHKDSMKKDGMSKDGMKKDGMSKDSMPKGSMSSSGMGGKMTPDPK